MEAWSSAPYWAREVPLLGHTVKLISPQFVKPFVKGNKNNSRDAEAIQIKLDEVIRALEGAHNALLDLEELEEEELDHIRADYGRLAEQARTGLRQGLRDTDVSPMEEDS